MFKYNGKVLPHGIPELIHRSTADYGALDFKVTISQDAVNHVRDLYINPNHQVFDLLPASLGTVIKQCYNQLGHPSVEQATIWGIYLELLDLVRQRQDMADVLDAHENGNTVDIDDELPLLHGLQDLHKRPGYLGGVSNGMGLHKLHCYRTVYYGTDFATSSLDRFLDDKPEIGDANNEIDAGPSLWVSSFTSDEEDSEEEDEVNDIL